MRSLAQEPDQARYAKTTEGGLAGSERAGDHPSLVDHVDKVAELGVRSLADDAAHSHETVDTRRPATAKVGRGLVESDSRTMEGRVERPSRPDGLLGCRDARGWADWPESRRRYETAGGLVPSYGYKTSEGGPRKCPKGQLPSTVPPPDAPVSKRKSSFRQRA